MAAEKSLRDQVADSLAKPGLHLPVFNAVALELQWLLQQEETPSSVIEATIGRDPALSVQVLRFANSAKFAGLAEIRTIQQALLRLGTTQVARLAMAAAQISLYRSKQSSMEARREGLWRESYAAAWGASWIAEKSGHVELADQAFLAGLLHDVGKLVILTTLEKLAGETHGGESPSRTVVDEMIEQLHCDQGYRLMEAWNLPEPYRVVARDHHLESFNAGNVLLVIVRLIDQVCEKMGIDGDPRSDAMPAASAEASALGLGEVQLAELEVILEDLAELQPA